MEKISSQKDRYKTVFQKIKESSKDYELLAEKKDADDQILAKAIEIVRNFIIDRKLILYGGSAIDYALRLRGSSLYKKDARPDLDVFSPNNTEDAYDLAEILHKAGFSNISAIRAIHVQTMRVRTDYRAVADISYMPKNIFDKAPFLLFNEIRVIHPDYQRMDLHLAFCFPYNDPPREDVFHRWEKDLKRINLLNNYYPITSDKLNGMSVQPAKIDLVEIKAAIDINVEKFALHGFAAFAFLRESFTLLVTKLEKSDFADIPLMSAKYEKKQISYLSPKQYRQIVIASPDQDVAKNAVEWYRPAMDAKPPMAIIQNDKTQIHLYYMPNRQLAISKLEKGIQIVTAQSLLHYFLYEAHHAEPTNKQIFLQFYLWTLKIINRAIELIDEQKDIDKAVSVKFTNTTPFGLTTRVLGEINANVAYLIREATIKKDLEGVSSEIMENLPANYYPPKTRPEKYDYSKNELFRRDGTKSLEKINIW